MSDTLFHANHNMTPSPDCARDGNMRRRTAGSGNQESYVLLCPAEEITFAFTRKEETEPPDAGTTPVQSGSRAGYDEGRRKEEKEDGNHRQEQESALV